MTANPFIHQPPVPINAPQAKQGVRLPQPLEERHYSVKDLAKRWGLSADTVRPWFQDEPGVLRITRPETKKKRGYTSLRISESIALAVYKRHTVGERRAA